MKQTIKVLGGPLFVVLTWSILTAILFFLTEACSLTTNFFLLFALTFLLYFGTMGYGFFYFHAFPSHRISPRYYRKKKFESL